MLLAALLRADGIPSRVCTGVVYSESAAVQESADPHQVRNLATLQCKYNGATDSLLCFCISSDCCYGTRLPGDLILLRRAWEAAIRLKQLL